jgi:hypothetical protein
MPKRVRTPNCTHVDMDRVYGRDLLCFVCGRSPSIGFLYECKQDSDRESMHDRILREQVDRIEPVKSDLRLELESVGLSESVILTAESGHYTNTQLTKLKELKLELRQTILDTRQASQINDAVAKLAAIARAPFDGTYGSMPNKDPVSALQFISNGSLVTHVTAEPPGLHFQSLSHLSPVLPRPRLHLSRGHPVC